MPYIISPTQLYQINGEVCTVLSAIEASGSTGNKLLVAAIAGKRHRVMGWVAQGSGATRSDFRLRNGAAGSYLMAPIRTPGFNDLVPAEKLEIVPSGYFEASTNTDLYVDVTNAAINLTVFYITYTP